MSMKRKKNGERRTEGNTKLPKKKIIIQNVEEIKTKHIDDL